MTEQRQVPAASAWNRIRIPPFSPVALKVLQLAAKDDSPLRPLADLLSTDPAFCSEILTVVNSPFFGLPVAVKSVLQAVSYLGLERVKGLALTVGIRAYLGTSLEVPALRACWRHSLATAVLASELARVSLLDSSLAYTAGMMHDIGRVAFAVCRPSEYAALLQKSQQQPRDVLELERELFGLDHCEAGKQLILDWHLPAEFAHIASSHHEVGLRRTFDVAAVVRHSCSMAEVIGFGVAGPMRPCTIEELLAELPERERNRFRPNPDDLTLDVAAKINSIESA